jgi:carbonic anhydrase
MVFSLLQKTQDIDDPCRKVGQLYETHKKELNQIDGVKKRNRRFAELNAWTQAKELMRKDSILDAIRERGLQVHAMMFDAESNKCVELSIDPQSNSSERGNRR